MSFDYVFKIALVGDSKTGKSNIFSNSAQNKFINQYNLKTTTDFEENLFMLMIY